MPTATFLSFRLGGPDGVSVEASKWMGAFGSLGWSTSTVAGEGEADVVLPGLAIDAAAPPTPGEVSEAVAEADLVVVENLCSLPLNPAGTDVVAGVLRGRPALLHHHDLPWQRPRFADWAQPVPDDPAWLHVTINDLSRAELAERGITATTVRNAFDTEATPGDRSATRAAIGVDDERPVVLQPTRAIARKGIPTAVALAESLDAVYWLLGPAEEGYGEELTAILSAAAVPIMRGVAGRADPVADAVADAYAACDVVAFPSVWEGFGNPTVESAVHHRPLALRRYPVAREIERFGFRWFDAEDPEPLRRWLEHPDHALLEHNHDVARRFFSLPSLVERLGRLLEKALWIPTR